MDKRVFAVGLLLMLCIGGWFGFWVTSPDPMAAPVSVVSTPKPIVRAHLPVPPRGVVTPKASLPRPEAAAPVSDASNEAPATNEAPASSEADPEPRSEGTLVDRREGARDGVEALAELQARLEVAQADIEACVGEWTALDPTLAGEVNLGFQLDNSGLTDVWVVDRSEVPFGPRTCFGTAIAEVDWAGVVRTPAEVTLNFAFDADHPGG